MADTNVIGDTADYTVFIGDNVAGSAVHGWYLKPAHIEMSIENPPSVKEQLELDNNITEQLGKHIIQFILKDILICAQSGQTAFQEFEKLKKALMYWATGNAGATYGGFLLYFVAKDVNGNEWSKVASFSAPTTLAGMRTKIINPIYILPQPNGDYLIKEMRIYNFKAIA